MTSRKRKHILVLTGAPDPASLTWDHDASLLDHFEWPMRTSVDADRGFDSLPAKRSTQSGITAEGRSAWRSVATEPRQHLHTGWSQAGLLPVAVRSNDHQSAHGPFEAEDTSFLATSELSTNRSDDLDAEGTQDVLSQYYEHSFTIHEDVESSQIVPESTVQDDSLTSLVGNSTAFVSDTSSGSVESRGDVSFQLAGDLSEQHSPLPLIRVCDVRSIPTAKDIDYFARQALSMNFIVGVISITSPRSIITRRMAQEMELVEVIVGDETKAGFTISFWLVPEMEGTKTRTSVLRESLSTVQRQDVVLVRNVALSTFRGQVYGQSLRKDVTLVEVLHRNKALKRVGNHSKETQAMARDNAQKVRRVKAWVSEYIGGPQSKTTSKEGVEELPPDTQ